jgi:hypothetical protein
MGRVVICSPVMIPPMGWVIGMILRTEEHSISWWRIAFLRSLRAQATVPGWIGASSLISPLSNGTQAIYHYSIEAKAHKSSNHSSGMSSEENEPHAGLVRLLDGFNTKPETIATAAEKLFARYAFFVKGSAEHLPKYPDGDVPRWMIIGPVEHERVYAFEELVRQGLFVRTARGETASWDRYRHFDDASLDPIVSPPQEVVPPDALKHAIRGVLANYSSSAGLYGVAERTLIDSIPHGMVALDRLVTGGVLKLAPNTDEMGLDEHFYMLTCSRSE